MSGVVTLSIELELGWGMHEKCGYNHLSKGREAETEALERLLSVADHLELPITFNIVGHLFEHSCQGTHAGSHPTEWWREDPGTNSETDPLFYAPDLISSIREAQVSHEFATHTYSHLLANNAPDGALADELRKFQKLCQNRDITEPDSIVMPRHQPTEYSILTEHGLDVIRTPIREYGKSFSNPISKAYWLLTRDHPVSSVRRQAGLLETTVTPHPSLTSVFLPSGQLPPHPVFSIIPRKVRQWLHQRYLINAINQTAQNNSHLHLWTHVYNFANDSQWKPMRAGLEHLASRCDEGSIQIHRMRDLSV